MVSISRINLPTVDSTNSFVRAMLQEEGTGHVTSANSLPGFTLVVADDQTKGRGQQGNAWETEKGKNLTFSLRAVCGGRGSEVAQRYLCRYAENQWHFD